MVDPVSAASGAKVGSNVLRAVASYKSRPGARLGSREERREVYSRFLAATASNIALAEHFQGKYERIPEFLRTRGRTDWERLPWFIRGRAADRIEDMRYAVQSDLLHAYLELRLVANEEPMALAERLCLALGLVMLKVGDSRQYRLAVYEALQTQEAFIDACRNDLWYLPRWWHVWRPKWWSVRWRQLRRPRPIHADGQG